ncbi:MAG: hypothetical protein ACE15C_02140 [Phycisphaerae bacterium]
MKWPSFTSRAPIGVDIGARHIRAAQVIGGRLSAAGSIPRTGPADALEERELGRLGDMLRHEPFRGRTVVLAAPAGKLLTGIMELPPRASGAPIDQLARTELARRHNADASALETACWDLPSPARAANRTYVMAVAYAQADAEALLNIVEAQGLNVQAIDVQSAAAARACAPLLEEVGGTGAILDLGWSSARLVLIHQHVVVYERILPKGGVEGLARIVAARRNVDVAIAEHLLAEDGVTNLIEEAGQGKPAVAGLGEGPSAHLEGVAAELRIPMSYLASQYHDGQLKRLLLIGGGAEIKGIDSFLASRLGIEVLAVRPGDLLDNWHGAEALEDRHGPSLVTAIGLSQFVER